MVGGTKVPSGDSAKRALGRHEQKQRQEQKQEQQQQQQQKLSNK
jgi:hypothetical protein